MSGCGRYRWSLHRRWSSGPLALWVMLNPSTADASTDDPTLRRCLALSRDWGFGAVSVANLFAWRATDPRELGIAPDPVGAHNELVLRSMAQAADVVVAAWGAHPAARSRAASTLPLLPPTQCVGITADGHPRHPLYVRRTVVLRSWQTPGQRPA